MLSTPDVIVVPRARVVGWDLPFPDAPALPSGLAAVAARYLADPRSDSVGQYAATRYWKLRHALLGPWSCFSFWAPGLTADAAARLADVARPAPQPELLRAVTAAHLAGVARQQADPTTAIRRALHAAAWGEPEPCGGEAGADGVAAIDCSTLADYLTEVVPRAELTVLDAAAGPVPLRPRTAQAERADDRRVRGGPCALVDRPWSQFVVGVLVGFDPVEVDEVALAVIRELLGSGTDGLLGAELRAARGLVYAAGAAGGLEHGNAVLWACANTDRDHALDCARLLGEVVDRLPASSADQWQAAARRAKQRVVTALDQPFARLDEHRRASLGQLTLAEVHSSADARAEELASRPPVPTGGRARAIVGGLDDAIRAGAEAWN
ncbi:hypothetical protein O7628_15970 [Micromonospora sp. WMMD956]|uniref:hypothetical protein n=1 Tax=Micromonospora TaxID=1873 RepID=UPI0024163699|nr:hypothetical protein [Micromonospora sp. WMMD956]MDG4816993.1 hypothetical protein [Micromonospora sp. WMMD956]